MKIAVRGFAGRRRVFEEILEADDNLDYEALVASHFERLKPFDHHMIEIEFLEEPNPPRTLLPFRNGSFWHGDAPRV